MNINKKLFKKQLLRFSLGAIVPSLIFSLFCILFPSYKTTLYLSVIINILFVFWILYVLFCFRMKYPTKKKYYKYNLSAMAVYCLIGGGSAFLLRTLNLADHRIIKYIYTVLFFNFKCFHYFSFNPGHGYSVGRTASAGFCFLVYMAIVLIFPLILNKHRILGMEKRKNIKKGKKK